MPRTKTKNSFRPGIETLEGRLCMAAPMLTLVGPTISTGRWDLAPSGTLAGSNLQEWADSSLLLQGRPFALSMPAGTLAARPAASASVVADESFRLGTLNFQYFPFSGLNPTVNFIINRAEKLADEILAEDYDVIALQEVWDDGAKAALIDKLVVHGPYQHCVAKLGNGQLTEGRGPNVLDSGLMLFSKFAFEELPDNAPRAETTWATSNLQPTDRVAFFEFDDSNAKMEEKFAGKGAGYVRLTNPSTGRTFNVVFTHLPTGDFHTAKLNNLNGLRNFLNRYGPAAQGRQEEIFIVGDFNVNGDSQARFLDERDRHYDQMMQALQLNGMTLMDAWDSEMHSARLRNDPDAWFKLDRGLSSEVHMARDDDGTYWGSIAADHLERESTRIDYILYLHPNSWSESETLAFQQLKLTYDLYHGQQSLSDHIGLRADLNGRLPRATSADARVIRDADFSTTTSTATVTGGIVQRHGMHWYRIDQGGTYTFSFTGMTPPPAGHSIPTPGTLNNPGEAPIIPPASAPDSQSEWRFEVYDSHDMSRPMVSYLDGAAGKYHFADDGIYYVRVWHSMGSTGNYSLQVHKHTGAALADARTLYPNETMDHALPRGSRASTWFQIDTDTPYNSAFVQTLTFAVSSGFRMNLFRVSDAGSLERVRNLEATGDGFQWIDSRSNLARLFLEVVPTGSAETFSVSWSTNLTIIDPLTLGAKHVTSDDEDTWINVVAGAVSGALGGALGGLVGSFTPLFGVPLPSELVTAAGAIAGAAGGAWAGNEATEQLKDLAAMQRDENIRLRMSADGINVFTNGGARLDNFSVGRGTGNHKSLAEHFRAPIGVLNDTAVSLKESDPSPDADDTLRGTIVKLAAGTAAKLGDLTLVQGDGGEYHLYSNLYRGSHRLGRRTEIRDAAPRLSEPLTISLVGAPAISVTPAPTPRRSSVFSATPVPSSDPSGAFHFSAARPVVPQSGQTQRRLPVRQPSEQSGPETRIVKPAPRTFRSARPVNTQASGDAIAVVFASQLV